MTVSRILIVEDQAEQAATMAEVLTTNGRWECACDIAASGEAAVGKLHDGEYDLVITDLVMAGIDGMAILKAVRGEHPETQVIMVSGYGTTEKAVQAMEEGAYSFLSKPLQIDELRAKAAKALERAQLGREKRHLERRVDEKFGMAAIKGNAEAMQRVFALIRQAAPTGATVLITGENGTGKELVANTLHQNSPRAKRPFVAFNCTEAPESLIEAILFGHEAGAFTDAKKARRGIFEQASGGTLFLDEIGELSLHVQPKLLRVLEERKVTPIGGEHPVPVDVRIIAATNRDLAQMVEQGRFRQDLFFRVNVLAIRVPPLRERLSDLPLLVSGFLSDLAREHGKPVRALDPEVLAIFSRYHWPGNVRELRNTIESMVILSVGDTLTADTIPPTIRPAAPAAPGKSAASLSLAGMTLEQIERLAIQQTLEMMGGNRERTAKALAIGERTLYRKIDAYNLHDTGRLRPAGAPAEG
ncbi:MAG: sigma-54-dependent Fis family transcriptional regulator [Planctomycetes bacterium]|nr:sigma-54-dependent Fis family transcriptional regulator [Planctomycetota bacterium]